MSTDRSMTATERVEPLTSFWTDQVIPAGKTVRVKHAYGHAPGGAETMVAVAWDRAGDVEYLFITYGDGDDVIDKEFLGDGSKTLSILLRNDRTVATWLQGRIDAVQID